MSHGETQYTTKSALLVSADRKYHDVIKGKEQTAAGLGRSVGYGFRASLHAYGGTFDSVTCHQRRYHYTRLQIVAGCHAVGCIQRWCNSLCRRSVHPPDRLTIPAHPLPGSLQTECICLPYSLVKMCLMVRHVSEPSGSQKRTLAVRFCEQADLFTYFHCLSYVPYRRYATRISINWLFVGMFSSSIPATRFKSERSKRFQQEAITVRIACSTEDGRT